MQLPHFLTDGPKKAGLTVALAHGAGAPMDSPFMETMTVGIAARRFRVVRFEFPYMARRRTEGSKRPPDRAPVLLETWRTVIAKLGRENLVIGGKSMGGRMASMIAAVLETEKTPVCGLICLGYPFHAPGKPGRTRLDHLKALKTPTLICQGTRDPFGTKEQVPSYPLPRSMRVHWLEDGEHNFKPRKASGLTEEQNLTSALDAVAAFLKNI
jgi:predicted alpha/beta-hydrolase family hydrolase